MPSFAYVAIDPRGRERSGRLAAPSRDVAQGKLTGQQLHVVRLAEVQGDAATGKPGTALPWRGAPRLRFKQLTLFTRQLATLSQVTPLEESLRTISRQSDRAEVRAIIGQVADGSTLR